MLPFSKHPYEARKSNRMGRVMDGNPAARRPVAARQTRWAHAVATWLVRRGLKPNQVSILSIAFAGLAGVCLILGVRAALAWHIVLFVVAAGLIQLRLLCNLMDGLMAVEGGLGTRVGPVLNELPDRLSDVIVLVCAGYAVTGPSWGAALGWAAAALALLTAYVRALAGSLGARQDFGGPMAKQQRMNVLTGGCLIAAALAVRGWNDSILLIALAIVIAGSAITAGRRTLHLIQELESK